MISLLFALLFGVSLLPGRKALCLVFAERISGGLIPEGAEAYCRRLTWVWFAVLALNGAFSGGLLAFGGSHALAVAAIWGFVGSPVVVATTFLVEKIVRRRRFSVTFHTSGSTSRPKTIVKTFESLAKEAVFHRDRLADELARKPRFIATIEPDHMYGILWRVLLPRAAGCEVDPDVVLTPEALVAKMRASESVFLVTTPSFLVRLAAYAEQYDVPRNCVEIVTSGALLTAEVSAATRRIFGLAPREIFGSTETGGVADRRQGGETPADGCDWNVFAPVRVGASEDGRLVVRSPFSCRRVYEMGDGVELAAGGRRFRLLGRRDRLVKINEERVSLPEMEARMYALEGVADAALVALDGAHGPILGAVVVPDGSDAFARLGKRRAALELRQRLLPIFPKGTVPRRYRFVHALPRNAQGKVLAADLREIFATGLVEPFVADAATTEDGWSARFTFDGDAPYFQGHFPELPILPGVVQLGLARHFAEMRFGRLPTLKAVKKMKFAQVISPGDTVAFELKRVGACEIAYAYRKGETSCSSGILSF